MVTPHTFSDHRAPGLLSLTVTRLLWDPVVVAVSLVISRLLVDPETEGRLGNPLLFLDLSSYLEAGCERDWVVCLSDMVARVAVFNEPTNECLNMWVIIVCSSHSHI